MYGEPRLTPPDTKEQEVCDICGEAIGAYTFYVDGVQMCAKCFREELTTFTDRETKEVAMALGYKVQYNY